jgi:hypothetical protein
LDKVLDGTSLPGKCRALCDGEPKATVVKEFCKEAKAQLETPGILNLIQGTLNQAETRLVNSFKELCHSLCIRINSIDSRMNQTSKSISAALLTRGDVSIAEECKTPGGH